MITFDPYHHMAEEVLKHWINQAPGAFSIRDLGITKMDEEAEFMTTVRLETLVGNGFLEHYGKKRGWYVKTETELEVIDLDGEEAKAGAVDIWLPFGTSDLLKTFPGNIIIYSGFKESGKTALSLNTAQQNRAKWEVSYFNSEMGAAELRERVSLSELTMDMWQVGCTFYRRATNFHEVVKPGPGNLNIIDFYEIHDEFYTAGRDLKAIHDKLKGAVAIINIQKNPGIDTPPLGGWRSLEVCRICLSIDSGVVKIKIGKNWQDQVRKPAGAFKTFKLVAGYKIIDRGKWEREKED